ncbi:MAG TPA: hypothetical protein VJR23_14995 [Candidatus Acidoferrales bacterium]|nr:hypothetical protein [Candidatus Acidoferrales bacterium]
MRFDRRSGVGTCVAIATVLVIVYAGYLRVPSARAVPSFSRQTGFPCSSCHTTPPELTPLGRTFKLNGYTLAGMATITSKKSDKQQELTLLQAFPLSVLFDTSFTATHSPQPSSQNGSFEFPQDASLFLAGAWSSHIGSFVQVTYSGQDDKFSWDNTDIRYSNTTKLFKKDLVYGISLNNNPSVEDLWNSTPAWGYPWINSDSAPTPTAAAIINGTLGQDVAGIGGYGMWDDHLYLAGTIYRSNHLGGPQPNPGATFQINIRGVAPYWRVAWQQTTKNNYFEVGSYGMHVKSTPENVTGLEDSFTDWAFDFQYDRTIPQLKNDILSFRGTYIRENSALLATFNNEGATQPGHHLNTAQANLEYHFGNRYSAAFGWFNVTGTPDQLLYFPEAVTGSANGSPASSGFIGNLSWWPVQNVDLAFQYTGYLRFNGASTNYDGSGRNAGDNNTVYLLARFVF